MEEIVLRDYIDVIIKRKWIIAGSIIICVLISVVLSFFVIQPTYEAEYSIMVNEIKIQSGINPSTTVIFSGDPKALQSTKKLENKMLGSILNQVKYPQIGTQKIVNYMQSTEFLTSILTNLKIDINKYKIKKNIKIEFDGSTNKITIKAKYNNPDLAIKICTGIIKELPKFIEEKAGKDYLIADGLIEKGVKLETQNIEIWNKKLDDILTSVGGSNYIDKLSSSKLGEYEEANNNYVLANQALEAYQLVGKELVNMKQIEIADILNLQIIEEQQMPMKPISPRKSLNLTLGFVLGLMLGTFIAFFVEYWKKTNHNAAAEM